MPLITLILLFTLTASPAAGDKVEFIITERKEALLRPITRTVDEVFGMLHKAGRKPTPVEIMNFVSSAKETKIDLSDILIAHAALSAGCETILTFDKHASSFGFFELLK